ncbi:MAG: alanine racemase [Actinomycetota bacterium]
MSVSSDPSQSLGRSKRSAHVEIDLGGVAHNVTMLSNRVAPARVMAVVKADAYGHGAVPVAEAALAAGADCLAVALVQEGIELRRAGIEDPILVLSEQPDSQVGDIVSHGLIATAYSVSFIDALEREVRKRNVVGHEVHLKVDTGMNRVGVHPSEAVERAGRIVACGPWLSLTGLYTHFATADDIDSTFAAEQLRRFETVLEGVRRAGIDIETVHAANSAGALLLPESRLDMVRLGISMYGIAPSESLESACADLRPALSLKSNVSYVKRVGAGEGVSYGSRYRCSSTTTIATVPIGYADGIARRSGLVGVEVLIGGRRHPIVGVVTMDQLMVDVGDAEIAVGDEVVLIGGQGGESISANEIAHRLGTIGYEVVCALADRLPRRYTEM